MHSQNDRLNGQIGPATAATIDIAIARLRREPGLTLRLFPKDWLAVDLARERAAASGLADRISIHHRIALGLLARRAS